MDYVCIKCRKTWRRGDESSHRSGALCDECTIEYVRDKQIKEGNRDCFGRAVDHCTEDCKWKRYCLTISGVAT